MGYSKVLCFLWAISIPFAALYSQGETPICLREWQERDVLVVYPPVDLSGWTVSQTMVKQHNVTERTGRPQDGSPEGFVIRWVPFIRGRGKQVNVQTAFADFHAEFPDARVRVFKKSDNYLYAEVIGASNNKAAAVGFLRGRRGWFQMVYYQFGDTPSAVRDRWLAAFEAAQLHYYEQAKESEQDIPCPLNPQPQVITPPAFQPPGPPPSRT